MSKKNHQKCPKEDHGGGDRGNAPVCFVCNFESQSPSSNNLICGIKTA